MKILNLYAGIGGNRKLWDEFMLPPLPNGGLDYLEVTAIENVQAIADIYSDFFPDDTMIIGDAHEYLLEHYGEFDFIWSSPPCPTHSRLRVANTLSPYKDNSIQLANGGGLQPKYPDMKLYEEIIFLKHFAKVPWVVENVISYYEPLIHPQEIAQHYFWSNFLMRPKASKTRLHGAGIPALEKFKGFDLSKYKGIDKEKILRNCVEPETAKQILDNAINPIKLQGALL